MKPVRIYAPQKRPAFAKRISAHAHTVAMRENAARYGLVWVAIPRANLAAVTVAAFPKRPDGDAMSHVESLARKAIDDGWRTLTFDEVEMVFRSVRGGQQLGPETPLIKELRKAWTRETKEFKKDHKW